jgi:hypothetical protein
MQSAKAIPSGVSSVSALTPTGTFSTFRKLENTTADILTALQQLLFSVRLPASDA